MEKTLTEQWRNGELPNGNYYTICSGWNMQTFPCVVYCERNCFGANVIEVLAAVPSYDEYNELVRKSDKLDKVMSDSATNQGDCQQIVEDNLNRHIESLQKDNVYMVKRCNYLEKENSRLNYQRDMYRHGLVEISELSANQLNDGTPWDIARYCISSYKAPNEADTFMDELSKKIARLQEQLNEANKALKEVCMHCETEQFECRCGWVEPCKDCNAHYAARDYLKKWGVK